MRKYSDFEHDVFSLNISHSIKFKINSNAELLFYNEIEPLLIK